MERTIEKYKNRRNIRKSKGRIAFECINGVIITFMMICCIVPILNLLAYSFSSSQAIIENRVSQGLVFPAIVLVLSISCPTIRFAATIKIVETS